ncbi:hypothetical protein BN2127_JRS9_03988 [Bacillus subtilis]|nr:hypothetical protein DFO78_1083 [Bacillus subtilis]CAI6299807.1 hypothetical protein NRS6131_14290 [Bacillus subtilis]CUB21728.1 hypothetical protein BN2127_JRS2_03777 [Bacillus subtilis]CUB50442.1 hypothetical protein BN2127_JRS11_03889 [Bacillus subtilis]CUB59342.1 hypothetical protein BN2127_JRS9_03988 [Bacillus subtilis]
MRLLDLDYILYKFRFSLRFFPEGFPNIFLYSLLK